MKKSKSNDKKRIDQTESNIKLEKSPKPMTDGGITNYQRDSTVSLTPSVRDYIFEDREHECELCGADETDVDLEIHHRTQQSDGGSNAPSNLLLICRPCHRRHHGYRPKGETLADEDREPLPPHSEPNETDLEILAVIEEHGPIHTKSIAEKINRSGQYIRRQCWKLSGELLIARTKQDGWELRERTPPEESDLGLPDTPKTAYKAGRDETLRQMSAHGISRSEITEITGLSRSTVEIAIYRARALGVETEIDDSIDLSVVTTQLASIVRLMDGLQPGDVHQ